MDGMTHFDAAGRARMVDVSDKDRSLREAIAQAIVEMQPETLEMIRKGKHAKGDVLAVAQIAAIMAAKKTPDLIPMCHPLPLESLGVEFDLRDNPSQVVIRVTAKLTGKTGVEMEALTGAAASALTVYDMCKAVDRGMIIREIALLRKEGGKSGTWVRE